MENDPALLVQFFHEANGADVQRILLFSVLAWDINCTQHITPRHTGDKLAQAITRLQQRITEPETEIAMLRTQLDGSASEKTV